MRILKVMKKGISKMLKVLLRRLVIVGVIIVLQIAWLIWMAQVIGERSKFIEWGLQLVSVAVVIYIVNKEENPAYKLAWTIPILIFPVFGGLLYLTLGNKKMARKLRLELERSLGETDFLLSQSESVMNNLRQRSPQAAASGKIYRYVRRLSDLSESSAKYYPSGESMFEEMIEDLKKAKYYIFMEFFIVEEGYMWNTILEILKERVDDGVEVRFMYDDVRLCGPAPV